MVVLNGSVPLSSLAPVEGMWLEKRAAAAYEAMKAEAADAGVTLTIARPAGAYRSYATQVDMELHPARYGISPGVTVARPRHSTHGFGRAVDIGSVPKATTPNTYGAAGIKRRAWLLENASRFGFSRPFGEGDHNHFAHNGTTTAGTPGTPITEENDMPRLIKTVTKDVSTYYRIDDPCQVVKLSKAEADAYNAAFEFNSANEVTSAVVASMTAQAARNMSAHAAATAAKLASGIAVTVPPISDETVGKIAATTSASTLRLMGAFPTVAEIVAGLSAWFKR